MNVCTVYMCTDIITLCMFTDRLLHTLAARGEVTCMAEGGDVLVAGQSGMEAKGRIWNLQTGGCSCCNW